MGVIGRKGRYVLSVWLVPLVARPGLELLAEVRILRLIGRIKEPIGWTHLPQCFPAYGQGVQPQHVPHLITGSAGTTAVIHVGQ